MIDARTPCTTSRHALRLTAAVLMSMQAQAELEAQHRDLAEREAAALAAEQRAAEIAEQASQQQAQQRDLDARQVDLADKEARSHTETATLPRCTNVVTRVYNRGLLLG